MFVVQQNNSGGDDGADAPGRKFPGFKLTAQLKTFLYPAVKNLSIAARRQRDRFSTDPAASAALDQMPGTQDYHSDDILKVVLSREFARSA